MHFTMINAPASFRSIHHSGCVERHARHGGQLDDTLIHAKTLEEHHRLAKEVLRRLQAHHLTVAPQKCVWVVTEVGCLGHIIAMSQEDMDYVLRWQRPTSLKATRSFIGFANSYRRFIRSFWSSLGRSQLRQRRHLVMDMDIRSWTWTPGHGHGLMTTKDFDLRDIEAFVTVPTLIYHGLNKIAIMETDALDFAIVAILSRKDNKRLHLVAFHSRKLSPADCFARWRRHL
jgi:hypothetical protein